MTQGSTEDAMQTAVERHRAGRLAEAEAICRQVLSREPNNVRALQLLGALAMQVGRPDVAASLYGRTIAIDPDCTECHRGLGDALCSCGNLDGAIAAYQEAIRVEPASAGSHFRLGSVLQLRGRISEAVDAYRGAVELKPDYVDALYNLGVALQSEGKFEEALAACERILELQSDHLDAHTNRGISLQSLGRLEEAEASYRSVLQLEPGNVWAHNNLGVVLEDLGQSDVAMLACREAIRIDPRFADAYYNLGNSLSTVGQLDEAIEAYLEAISIDPRHARAYNNLGVRYKDCGRLDEAIDCYRKAVMLQPKAAAFHSNLIYTLHFHPSCDAVSIQKEHRLWNQQFALPLRPSLLPHSNDTDPSRRLRIGYVSPDFRVQAEAHFVAPLFEAHDRNKFEIYCYASVRRPDAMTARLRRSSSVWRDVLKLSDAELADQIRLDGIDILVDLTMHMAMNRLTVFARKPAPIQVAWLAYPGSTGLDTIDYRITDSVIDPPELGTEGYSEESIRLPDSWCCYDPLSDASPSPAETPHWGRSICFGSLNNPCKLNEPVLRLWARVLDGVPNSRLLLFAESASQRAELLGTLETLRVNGSRIEFIGRTPRETYLDCYKQIDIALDPLPYNGITTTCDALWMGVPVVSLAGNTASGRAGSSILAAAGLPELAAPTPEEFVRVATGLALDLPRLLELRKGLRERMLASPVMNPARFAAGLESAYCEMWREWRRKQRDDGSPEPSII